MKLQRSELPVEDPRRVDRIRNHTASSVLDEIDRKTATRVFKVARTGTDAIVRRMEELDKEWDVERFLALHFTIASTLLARRHRWVLRIVQATMLLHVASGWSPQVALLRRLGVRTQKEIDAERAVLSELLHLFADETVLPSYPEFPAYEDVEEAVYDPATATSVGTAERW